MAELINPLWPVLAYMIYRAFFTEPGNIEDEH
jgi:hypothetical protein